MAAKKTKNSRNKLPEMDHDEALLWLEQAIHEKVDGLWDESWNPNAHVEVTLTIAQARAFVAMSREANDEPDKHETSTPAWEEFDGPRAI